MSDSHCSNCSDLRERVEQLERQCDRQRRRIAELKAFIRSFAHNFQAVLREKDV